MYPCAHPVVNPATPSPALESLFELPEDKLHVDHAYFRPRIMENLIARHLAPALGPKLLQNRPRLQPAPLSFWTPKPFPEPAKQRLFPQEEGENYQKRLKPPCRERVRSACRQTKPHEREGLTAHCGSDSIESRNLGDADKTGRGRSCPCSTPPRSPLG